MGPVLGLAVDLVEDLVAAVGARDPADDGGAPGCLSSLTTWYWWLQLELESRWVMGVSSGGLDCTGGSLPVGACPLVVPGLFRARLSAVRRV